MRVCVAIATVIAASPVAPASAAPSQTLERAVALYTGEDYTAAALLLSSVVEGETGDSAEDRQRAEFFLGKSLYHLEYRAVSLASFARIAQAGPAHRYHGAALKWLAALARITPAGYGVLEIIGTYDEAVLDEPVMADDRDELRYRLGVWSYERGDFEVAARRLARVPTSSPHHLRAKLVEAAAHLRRYKAPESAAALRAILAAGPATADKRLRQLAALQLARIFVSTDQLDLALEYYGWVQPGSPERGEALVESSWALLYKGQQSLAAGRLDAASAPFFGGRFEPEAAVMRALVGFDRCLDAFALASTDALARLYAERTAALEGPLAHDDNAELFAAVAAMDRTGAVWRVLRRDPRLSMATAAVAALDRELERLAAAPPSLTQSRLGTELLQELTIRQSLATADAGAAARHALDRAIRELREHHRHGIRIRIATLERRGAGAKPPAAMPVWERLTGPVGAEVPVALGAGSPVWSINGGFGRPKTRALYRLRRACETAPTRPEPIDETVDENQPIELAKPDGDMGPPRPRRRALIAVPENFIAESLRTIEGLRAEGVL